MNRLSIKLHPTAILRLCISLTALVLVVSLSSCGLFSGGSNCDCKNNTFSEATENFADPIEESTEKETVTYVE